MQAAENKGQQMPQSSVSRRVFFGVSAMLFVASAAMTIVGCASMSTMGEMPMPGGWTMSMVWMPMCGQTWPQAAASFIGMWIAMMVAMMLPSLAPMLWRYRQAMGKINGTASGWMIALVGIGYFTVWASFGMAAFALGSALAALEMQVPALARTVPIASGVVVLVAGALQFTAWKARHLACCRVMRGQGRSLRALQALQTNSGTAWRRGLRLGIHCSASCAGATAVLLATGVMDLRVMAAVTAVVTVERLAPGGEHAVKAIGMVVVVAGLVMLVRAMGLG